MNYTINLTELNKSITQINKIPKIEEIVTDICQQWEQKTKYSHNVYIKLLVIWGILHFISFFWNPYINIVIPKKPLKFLGIDIYLFRFQYNLIDFLKNYTIIIMCILIIDIFAINYFYIENKTLLDFINMLIIQKLTRWF